MSSHISITRPGRWTNALKPVMSLYCGLEMGRMLSVL